MRANELEEKSFKLLLDKIQCDVDLYVQWKQKCSDFATSEYFKTQEILQKEALARTGRGSEVDSAALQIAFDVCN